MKSFIRLALSMSLAVLAFAALQAEAPQTPQSAAPVAFSAVSGIEKICGELLQKAHDDDLYVTCFPKDPQAEFVRGRAQGYKNSATLLRLAVKLHPEDFAKQP